jgi:hypothetical protein
MDRNDQYRALIRRELQDIADFFGGYSPHQMELVFDEDHGHYHVGRLGWEGVNRIDIIYVHIDLIGDMVWLQRNATDICVAEELVKAGIPRDHIVLGFQPPEVRPDTDYAVA